MTSFGILTLNQQQEEEYFREIGKKGEQKGITVHRFIPSRIDPYTEKATGETFSNGNWIPETFAIPNILYDRCFYSTRESYKINAPIVEWLKNRTMFLGFGLPNKWKVYQCIRNNVYLNHYTIETEKAVTANVILRELTNRNIVLLKPESGSQGKGIFIIEKKKNAFVVRVNQLGKSLTKNFGSETMLKKWLNLRLMHSPFLIQPLLSLKSSDGRPFDLRIVLQKDAHGNWIELGRGIRLGKKDGMTANLHNGGKLMSFERWFQKLPRMKRSYLLTELEAIVDRVPNQLEQSFGPLFEIGLDIGIDQEGAIWILEANSKPGHRTVLESGKINREQMAEAPLQYGDHLLKQKELKEDDD